MNSSDSIKYKVEVLMAGIDRFYTEGFYGWKKKHALAALKVESDEILEDPVVQQAFKDWQDQGFIEFIGRDDCYFKVLKPFPYGYKYFK